MIEFANNMARVQSQSTMETKVKSVQYPPPLLRTTSIPQPGSMSTDSGIHSSSASSNAVGEKVNGLYYVLVSPTVVSNLGEKMNGFRFQPQGSFVNINNLFSVLQLIITNICCQSESF